MITIKITKRVSPQLVKDPLGLREAREPTGEVRYPEAGAKIIVEASARNMALTHLRTNLKS